MRRLVLFVFAAGVALWLFKPEVLTDLANRGQNLLKEKAKEHSQSVVLSAVSSVNRYVKESSKAVLGEQISLPIEEKPEAEIVKDVPKKELDNIILIDYFTAKNLKLELKPNLEYYLDLRNVPEGYCLYVNQVSYFVAKNEFLNISFDSSGNYALAFDKCDKKMQKFGEIVVE